MKQYSHQSDAKMVIDVIVMTLIKQRSTKWQYHQTEKLSLIINPLNAELNPIRHLLALLGGATIVVVSRLRVNL